MEEKNNLRIRIEKHFSDNPGKSFGVSEIARTFNVRRNTIHYHLKILKARAFLGQDSNGAYYLKTGVTDRPEKNENLAALPILGAGFNRLFPAFLVSSFLPVVQAWLGTEYNRLSKDLDEIGVRSGSIGASKASIHYKRASIITMVIFACIIVFVGFFAFAFSYNIVHQVIPPIFIGNIIESDMVLMAMLACVINIILRKAWRNVLAIFTSIEDLPSSLPITIEKTAQVIMGVNCCIVSSGMLLVSVVAIVLVAPYFTIDNINNTFFFVSMLSVGFLILIGAILGLIGLINQASGILNLSKILQQNTIVQSIT
jgi:hypothetical protein